MSANEKRILNGFEYAKDVYAEKGVDVEKAMEAASRFAVSIKTMAQTAVSMITVGQAVMDVNWLNVLSVSIVAGILSLLTSIAGLPEIDNQKVIYVDDEEDSYYY